MIGKHDHQSQKALGAIRYSGRARLAPHDTSIQCFKRRHYGTV